jgi:hypothetical protein
MKVGTYTGLSAPLFGFAMLWTSAACGTRTSLLLEEDAGVTTDTPSQESNTGNNGGRAGSSTTGRAGRGATAGAGGMGSTATGGRAGRAGRGGEAADQPRGGAGGRPAPRDRDAAADSGEDEEQPSAGSGGEESGGSGGEGEQAGTGGEAAGAGGEGAAGEAAAGSGGSDAEPVDAGTTQEPEGDRLTALSPEQTTEICNRIEAATANLQWNEAVSGWCSRGSLGTPECPASQEACVNGSMILPICAQSVPDCPDITIEEFVTCRTDSLLSFVEYNRTISCDTPPGQPGEAEVASCVGPYQRCAPLAALAR